MEIVIDEWIVHHIGDADKQGAVFHFLQHVLAKCDKFVTIKGEALPEKMLRMTQSPAWWDPVGRELAKRLWREFLWNSEKFRLLEHSDLVAVPAKLERQTPPDDLYLVRAALTTSGVIVTTDTELNEILSPWADISICMVDEFLSSYDC